MADEYMAIESDSPDDDLIVIHQGGGDYTAQPYLRTEESNWGNPTKVPQYASSIDTEGSHLTGVSLGPRQKDFVIMAQGATKTLRLERFQALYRVAEDIVRYRGGWLTVRRRHLERTVRFRIVFADCTDIWGKKAARSNQHPSHLQLVCRPYGYLQSFTVEDTFDVDSIAAGDWDFDAGNAGMLTVAGGAVAPNGSLGTERRLIRAAEEAYEYEDFQVDIELVSGAVTNGSKISAILKRVDDENYLIAYVEVAGGIYRSRVDAVVGGVPVSVLNSGGLAVIASTQTVNRFRIQGNRIWVSRFARAVGGGGNDEPWPLQGGGGGSWVASNHGGVSLPSDALRALYGKGVKSSWGWGWTPVDATERVKRVRVTRIYGGGGQADRTFPALHVIGDVPGDADADLDARVGFMPSSPTPRWVCVAAWPLQEPVNRVVNPGFENGSTAPWTIAAVTGLTVAATSLTASTSGPYSGTYGGRLATTATLGSGTAIPIYGGFDGEGFKVGEPVRVRARLRGVGGATTQMIVGVGVNGDSSPSAAVALTAAWQEITVPTWYPTATAPMAYVFVKTNQAIATTLDVDVVLIDDSIADDAENGDRLGGQPLYGVHSACNAESLTGMAVASNAAYRLGSGLRSTAASGSMRLRLLPRAARRCVEFGDTLLVELFARVEIAASSTPTITTRLLTGTTYVTPSDQPAAKAMASNGSLTFRIIKLGTFSIPARDLALEQWYLEMAFSGSASGSFGIDWITSVPALRRAAMPTGATASVDGLADIDSDLLVGSDLVARRAGSFVWGGSTILGGAPLRVPRGGAEVLTWLSDQAPDGPQTVATMTGSGGRWTELLVTPKVAIHEAD